MTTYTSRTIPTTTYGNRDTVGVSYLTTESGEIITTESGEYIYVSIDGTQYTTRPPYQALTWGELGTWSSLTTWEDMYSGLRPTIYTSRTI